MKTCFKCHQSKPLSEFYVHKQMADGHLNKCKECTKADTAAREAKLKDTDPEWYEKELERHRIKAAGYRKSGIVSAHHAAGAARWARNNPHKRRAQNRVAKAVKGGLLEKRPCAVCGSDDAQAHHEDYSKPLDVVWFCAEHHAARHRELNKQRRLKRFQDKKSQI